LLAGYEIIDDPLGAQNAAPTADDDGAVCLHTDVEAYEDEPTRGAASTAVSSSTCAARPRTVTPRMRQAVPTTRRDRALPEDALPPESVRRAYTRAIRRAARDAHRAVCDRDAVHCAICREHAATIAEAKWGLDCRLERLC